MSVDRSRNALQLSSKVRLLAPSSEYLLETSGGLNKRWRTENELMIKLQEYVSFVTWALTSCQNKLPVTSSTPLFARSPPPQCHSEIRLNLRKRITGWLSSPQCDWNLFGYLNSWASTSLRCAIVNKGRRMPVSYQLLFLSQKNHHDDLCP